MSHISFYKFHLHTYNGVTSHWCLPLKFDLETFLLCGLPNYPFFNSSLSPLFSFIIYHTVFILCSRLIISLGSACLFSTIIFHFLLFLLFTCFSSTFNLNFPFHLVSHIQLLFLNIEFPLFLTC